MNNIWLKFALLESTDIIKRLFKEKHNLELNTGKAKEIVSNFVQGREYFSSAVNASEIVKPLLQYYGVVSLSRGLILFLNASARETSLKPSHGLSLDNVGPLLSKGLVNIPDIPIKITNGTFIELYNATKNKEKFWVTQGRISNTVALQQTVGADPVGKSFTLKDLLSRMPVLESLYKRVFNENPNFYACHLWFVALKGEFAQVAIHIAENEPGSPTVEELFNDGVIDKQYYLYLARQYEHLNGRDSHYYVLNGTAVPDFLSKIPIIKSNLRGENFAVKPMSGGINLSTLIQFYSVSYFMSMLVRYFPSHWISLISRSSGDMIYPIFRVLSDEIQQRFPALIMAELGDVI